jgi:hypothetical protein
MLLFLFRSRGWECVSELRPPTGQLLNRHMIYEYHEPRWNDVDGRKLKSSDRNLSQYYLTIIISKF